MIIGKRFYFDAAHHLPGHPGLCKNLHGHTYTLDVEVYGVRDSETGMIMDLHDLDKLVKDILVEFDHTDLNQVFFNYDSLNVRESTCENLLTLLKEKISAALPSKVMIQGLKLQEGNGGWARC